MEFPVPFIETNRLFTIRHYNVDTNPVIQAPINTEKDARHFASILGASFDNNGQDCTYDAERKILTLTSYISVHNAMDNCLNEQSGSNTQPEKKNSRQKKTRKRTRRF